MSFFDDVLNNFELKSLLNEIVVTMVVGVGIMIVGNISVSNFNSEEITLDCKGVTYKILGSDLKLKFMAKGEISITGDVLGFVRSK